MVAGDGNYWSFTDRGFVDNKKQVGIYRVTIKVDENAGTLASKYGLGIEIADFCTAWNMDERLAETDAQVQKMVCGITKRVLHGPFSELFPCAIDPKIRAVAKERYQQAVATCILEVILALATIVGKGTNSCCKPFASIFCWYKDVAVDWH